MLISLVVALTAVAAHGQPLRRSSIVDAQALLRDTPLARNASIHRALEDTHKFFTPLSCNDQQCQQGSKTWQQMGFDSLNGPVVIPCGVCVTMNYGGDTLVLKYGLDVRGTLNFPNGYSITIETPYVIVQGKLEMTSTRRVSGQPDIKFSITGTDQVSFIPEDENEFVCSPSGASKPTACAVGFKPLVVAGGQVVIRGLPNTCTTWTKLKDVDNGGLPSQKDILIDFDQRGYNPLCSNWNYMSDDFSSDTNSFDWTGGYGAFFQITDEGTFLVSGRKSNKEHAPTWDMLWVRNCLVPGQKYLFSARVKLTKSGTSAGDLTSCAVSGNNCLWLFSTIKTPTGQLGRKKGYWEKGNDIRYGVWTDFHATFEYINEELATDNIYQMLQLRGPEAGVDIEIDDVQFSLPDPMTVPDLAGPCDGNLVRNGDASAHAIHPYPMTHAGGYLSVEEESNGNTFFRQIGRDSDRDSIMFEFPAPDCLVANGRYRVSASLRIDSNTPVQILIEVRSQAFDNTAVTIVVAECDGISRNSWTTCTADVALPPAVVGNFASTRLQLETVGSPTANVDIDNLQMELLDGSVTSIIVPADGIENCWGAGAEILITSHTLSYQDSQVRTLVSNPVALGDGFVKLELNEAIVPATTTQESPDFAVEVALLSRNILFEGANDFAVSLMGAHFMIMQTAGVPQFIDGAEFQNFGQQGILGRYVSAYLCGKPCTSCLTTNFEIPSANPFSFVRRCFRGHCEEKLYQKIKPKMYCCAWH